MTKSTVQPDVGCHMTSHFFYLELTSTDNTNRLIGFDLQDGLEGDSVTVIVNGKTCYDKKNMSSDLLAGFAKSFNTTTQGNKLKINVSIPTKNIRNLTEIDFLDTYVGLSVEKNSDGKYGFKSFVSHEPFYYM